MPWKQLRVSVQLKNGQPFDLWNVERKLKAMLIFLDSDDLRLMQGEVERPHGSCHGFGTTSSQRCPAHCPDGGQSTKSCRAMTVARSTYGGV